MIIESLEAHLEGKSVEYGVAYVRDILLDSFAWNSDDAEIKRLLSSSVCSQAHLDRLLSAYLRDRATNPYLVMLTEDGQAAA